MSTSFMQFKQVVPQQFFAIHGREWVKCLCTHQFEDFEYNAVACDKPLLPGMRLEVDVRYFDEATLVSIDHARPLFENRISSVRDNDN